MSFISTFLALGCRELRQLFSLLLSQSIYVDNVIVISVGHVNADLYSLVAGKAVSVAESLHHEKEGLQSTLKLLNQYLEVLCVNSWQVTASMTFFFHP